MTKIITIVEIGDESIIVKEDLRNITCLYLGNFKSENIISTPEGSVIYFTRPLKEFRYEGSSKLNIGEKYFIHYFTRLSLKGFYVNDPRRNFDLICLSE